MAALMAILCKCAIQYYFPLSLLIQYGVCFYKIGDTLSSREHMQGGKMKLEEYSGL